MNILYIHTGEERDIEIFNALKTVGANLHEENAPTVSESKETYVARLLKAMEEGNIDVCFSLDYFSIVSIGCEAMKRVYIAYTQQPYTPSMYSMTLKNSCNLVFVPDYSVYERFKADGYENVLFMPLGVSAERIADRVTEADSEDGPDLTITESVKPREQIKINLVGTDSPLKDATKGYLEGCIACRHQIRGLPSMYRYLPPYIKEEILKLTPPVLDAMSTEGPETYYDNRSFNELVTTADRDIHFSSLIKNDHFEKVSVYADGYESDNEKVSVFGTLKRGNEFDKAVKHSKINLIIPHRNWISGVSGRIWDTMAAGGFVTAPFMADLPGLFDSSLDYMFTDEFSMVSKSINRLHHPTERVETINSLLDELKDRHTHVHRVSGIFDYLG
ncbi:MAG: DUF3880 domain-containing protein [Lachnospiraceae bacterium]|nr:DUF3880 domain-containing protein [Lachnospiraceae bacterium]